MLDKKRVPVLHTGRMRGTLERLATDRVIEPEIQAIAARALTDPAGLTDHEVDLLIAALMGGGPIGSDPTC